MLLWLTRTQLTPGKEDKYINEVVRDDRTDRKYIRERAQQNVVAKGLK